MKGRKYQVARNGVLNSSCGEITHPTLDRVNTVFQPTVVHVWIQATERDRDTHGATNHTLLRKIRIAGLDALDCGVGVHIWQVRPSEGIIAIQLVALISDCGVNSAIGVGARRERGSGHGLKYRKGIVHLV